MKQSCQQEAIEDEETKEEEEKRLNQGRGSCHFAAAAAAAAEEEGEEKEEGDWRVRRPAGRQPACLRQSRCQQLATGTAKTMTTFCATVCAARCGCRRA